MSDIGDRAKTVVEQAYEQCGFNRHCDFCGRSISSADGTRIDCHAPDCSLVLLSAELCRANRLEDDATREIMTYFSYSHLPLALQDTSRRFCELAEFVVASSPPSGERLFALRQILIGKDAAVRAMMKGGR